MHVKYGKKIIWQDKDTWNLDSKLNGIIHSALVKFKEVVQREDNCAGMPGDFVIKPKTDVNFKVALANWYETLDKMIYAFDSKSEPDIMKYNFSFCSDSYPILGAFSNINNRDEYDRYIRSCEKYEAERQEGLDLFSKYYNNLWW